MESECYKERSVIFLKFETGNQPWEIDFIGPLKNSQNVNKYIPTIIDHYRKKEKRFICRVKRKNFD